MTNCTEILLYDYLCHFDVQPLLTQSGDPHPLAVDRIARALNLNNIEVHFALKWLAKIGAVDHLGAVSPLQVPEVDPVTAACAEFCERRYSLPEAFDATVMNHALAPLVQAAKALGVDITLEVKAENSKDDLCGLAEKVLDAVDGCL